MRQTGVQRMTQVPPLSGRRGKSDFSLSQLQHILLLSPDCATTLTRRDPKHTHTHMNANTQSEFSPVSHTGSGQAHSQVLFLLDFMGTLKFSPGRECRHNNQSSCHQAPSARWSGCSEGKLSPTADMFPFRCSLAHAGPVTPLRPRLSQYPQAFTSLIDALIGKQGAFKSKGMIRWIH